jgi:pimeloyl-ACP methyl ester carboxylesterase
MPAQPLPTAADSASPAAGLAYFRRMNGAPLPEADFRATEKFDSTGRDLGPATPQSISAAVVQSAEATAPPFAQVRVPALAIYDRPVSAAEALPEAPMPDTTAARWLRFWQQWRTAQQAEFKAKIPRAKIVVLQGASHYVFLTQPDTVASAMRAFLTAP